MEDGADYLRLTLAAARTKSHRLGDPLVPARQAPAAAANTMLDSEIALGLSPRAIIQDASR